MLKTKVVACRNAIIELYTVEEDARLESSRSGTFLPLVQIEISMVYVDVDVVVVIDADVNVDVDVVKKKRVTLVMLPGKLSSTWLVLALPGGGGKRKL